MDAEQQRRVAANEARFRDANERTKKAADDFQREDTPYAMMCECALTECLDMIQISRDGYAKVRSHPAWFMVRPEHVLQASEEPVEQHEEYWIVEKLGFGAEVAGDLA